MPSNSTAGIYCEKTTISKRHMTPSVLCGTVYNSQDMEASEME